MTAGSEGEKVNDPVVEEEKSKLGQSAGEKAQTRFNFYNAEEVKLATSGDAEGERVVNKEPTRFSYYNPEEVHKSAPLQIPKPIDLSNLGAETLNEEAMENAPLKTDTNVDSTEILRSLQETELSIKAHGSNNPYEAAIHDALAMLRSKNNRDKSDDKILESREATYSEVRESEVRSREERLAKYAAKLVQLEGRPLPKASSSTSGEEGTRFVSVDQAEVDRLFRARSEYQSEYPEPIKLAFSHESLIEEEVQKGVERVLMAILERAHSQGRAEAERGEEREAKDERVKPPSRRTAEEYITDDESDDNEEAREQVRRLGATLSGDTGNKTTRSNDTGNKTSQSTDTGNKRSVVDELLAETDETAAGDAADDNATTHSSTMVAMPVSPQSEFSKLTAEPGLHDEKPQEETAEEDETEEEEEPDDLDDDITEEDDDLIQSSSLSHVLGPLSGRNTTGVVLESSDSIQDDETEIDEEEETAGTRSDAPSSILDSLSTAVKDAETFMSFMTGAISPSSDVQAKRNADKYLTRTGGGDGDFPDDDSFDGEANELMRSLCAHLLPYGVDKSTKHLSEIPPWDDSNPNEPGYRIIRLSKSQLRRVEREFERMVNSVKRRSERDLRKTKGLALKDPRQDWNGVTVSPYDQRFEKDLEEAEDLLDREEKLRAAVDHGEMVKKLKDEERSLLKAEETEDSDAASEGNDEKSGCHPDFPGVRRSGKGEMGDLEFFTLPIIFKSHVTGFEPTKDLYLEPGNVVAGQYLVENELGSAAFSTAYRCIDLNSDSTGDGDFHEEVCLKVIKNTKDFFDQSLDEIKILELLRQTGKCHENNILEMKTFFYHREHLIIVTELLRQNLFEFGKFIIENDEEPYFTKRRLCYLTRQVLQALKFVHDLGLVHSDVKPENILLASYSRARVKLIDFGSSCYLTDRQSSYIQSRSYRAPEVVLGLPYDGKIDVWSLGCVVAEMYTGDVTFQNDSIVSMLSRIEAICGPFPRHMIAQGRQSSRFFSKSGLLYELVEPDERRPNPVQDDDETGLFDVFQPKRTSLAARLGFNPKALELPLTPQEQEEATFVDFCQSLLTIDPDARLSAEQALQHPWIVSGESLTEESIKYPST